MMWCVTRPMMSSPEVRPVPLLSALAALAVALLLAWWQLERAHEKEARTEQARAAAALAPLRLDVQRVDARQVEGRKATASGAWRDDKTILLDNEIHDGVAGYHVLTPLCRDGIGRPCVLVDRGWLAVPRSRGEWPVFSTPRGEVMVSGVARMPERRLTLSADTVEGRVWQALDLGRYAAWAGLALQPVVVVATGGGSREGLVRAAVSVPSSGAARHYGFAAMWAALGLTAVVMWAVHTRSEERRVGKECRSRW